MGRAGPKGGAHRSEPSTRNGGRATTPAQSQAVRRFGRAAIIVAALVLVALAWVGARDAIRAHRSEARARVQAEVLATTQASRNSCAANCCQWTRRCAFWITNGSAIRTTSTLPPAPARQSCCPTCPCNCSSPICSGIVRASSRPAIIGTDVGNRDYFRHEASLAADDDKMFVGELTQGQVTRLWQINLVRRLDTSGWHIRRRDRRLVRHQFVHAILSRGRSRHARR